MFNDENIGKLDKDALKQAKLDGKKIGLVQGSWDQFHIGHLRYIKKAKENCDYLIVGVDSDAKIQKRKGKNRPLIPEIERYEMIKELGIAKKGCYEPGKSIADDIVIKSVDEKKWELINEVKPDILITITENYSLEEYKQLTEICSSLLILPRQAETSTSDKLRKKLIANMSDKVDDFKIKFEQAVRDTIKRLKLDEKKEEPYFGMMKHLNDSTDWITPVVSAAILNEKWYFGTNQCDYNVSKEDFNKRTELFYSTVEHAEINLLKRISDFGEIDTIYVSLFPCDRCMKTLIDKGIKRIYYLEDHLDRNWSKRSHELADKKGIELINVNEIEKEDVVDEVDYSNYSYIYPPNSREQQQLDIMIDRVNKNEDPLDPNIIGQEIIFKTKYWYISENMFPYEGAEHQFLIAANDPIYTFENMNLEMWAELQQIWLTLINKYNMKGGAFCFRYGDPAKSGATLKRLHAHLIMPQEEKKTKFSIGGNKVLRKELHIKKY